MKNVLDKLKGVRHVTEQEIKLRKKDLSIKEMTKKSIIPATIQPEVWIAFGLLSSVVQQIVAVSLRIKATSKLGH